MAGSRRFLLLGFIGVVLILSFWYRPPPSIRAYAPAWALPKGTSKDETYPYAAEDSVEKEHAAPDNSVAFHLSFGNVQGVHTAIQAIDVTSIAPTSVALIHDHIVSTATITAAPVIQTASAPAWTPAAPADPFATAGDADLFEYLHESKSEGSAGTSAVDEFAYLSETHVAHLSSAGAASAHPTAAALSGFVTSVVNVHHSSIAAGHHESSTQAHSAATPTQHAVSMTEADPSVTTFPDPDEKEFGGGHWFFQNELTDYELPKFDVQHLKTYKPHNYKGPGHDTYATFLSTRNTSLRDPYFLATLQQAHRLLWDPHVKSKSTPFTVFVAPHIPRPQRDYLAASGAYVKEIDLIEFHPPTPSEAAPRWRDMFTKLNLWAQIDFKRILYLDTDAFVINPIDELWDIAKTQRCVEEKLAPADLKRLDEICDYTFTAVGDDGGINAGMMIFDPNDAMHARLIRESQDPHKFDPMYMEQAFLSVEYERPGAFPLQEVERKWNAIFTKPEDEGNVNVVHEKLWAMWFSPEHFAANYFRTNWDQMLKLYETPEWVKMRTAGGPMSI